MFKAKELTIGADPEFFVRRNGHYISAHDFGCGTKKQPMKTLHGFIQVDGVALECNVPPAKTKPEFVKNVFNVMSDLQAYVTDRMNQEKIVAAPAVWFGRDKITALPEEARKLGCEPDWNAYTGTTNAPPNEYSEWRTASGHIHLGWTDVVHPRGLAHMLRCKGLARQLDYYVGLYSLLWDKDHTRRSLYGKAGAFRPKSYGIEYRVLSNKWLSSGDLAGVVFDQAKKAYDRFQEGENLDEKFHGLAHDIINEGRVNWRKTYPEVMKAIQ